MVNHIQLKFEIHQMCIQGRVVSREQSSSIAILPRLKSMKGNFNDYICNKHVDSYL